MSTLVLGCGERVYPGATRLDSRPGVAPDIVHDLDRMPWPIPDGAYDRVIADHILEHVADRVGFLAECHRILSGVGVLEVEVPHYKHHFAWGCIEHRAGFAYNTFDPHYSTRGWLLTGRDFRTSLGWIRTAPGALTDAVGRGLSRWTGAVSGFRFTLKRLGVY